MISIIADASLPGLKKNFPPPFALTLYHSQEELIKQIASHEILLCRSTLKLKPNLFNVHSLRYVATASSGTDHLDKEWLEKHHISILDAKGCNAASVADYVLSCLAIATLQHRFKGRTAGVIGVGMVGTTVAARLNALGFDVRVYDPPKALKEQDFISCSLEELYSCNLICVHAELHHNAPYPSYHLINADFFAQLNPGCVIINASRGGIVQEEALLACKKKIIYCTDVYTNEPKISAELVRRACLATPHIAGHSLEGKFRAVALISEQLHRLYQLAPPHYAEPKKPVKIDYHDNQPWENQILALYNPLFETKLLKEAKDLEITFQSLRKQHHQRHDFSEYFVQGVAKWQLKY